MIQTIAQQIKWDFKTNGVLEIRDKNGNLIYFENTGGWDRHEYNSEEKLIYYENSDGYWEKQEWDSKGKEIYYENSKGVIKDKRPKPCENKVVEIDGEKFKLVKV
jgi:hypothetical protein